MVIAGVVLSASMTCADIARIPRATQDRIARELHLSKEQVAEIRRFCEHNPTARIPGG